MEERKFSTTFAADLCVNEQYIITITNKIKFCIVKNIKTWYTVINKYCIKEK